MRPYRREKVASIVQEIVSEAIVHRLNDPRIVTLTTVTRVEMSGDLQIAKVYLSVPGDDSAESRTLQALRHAGGYIQRMVARELNVRQCPELRFDIDAGAKGARRTLELLAENRRSDPALIPDGEQAKEVVRSMSDEPVIEAPACAADDAAGRSETSGGDAA